jgi:RNA polymerase sigma-70 factor, ECF subfamily
VSPSPLSERSGRAVVDVDAWLETEIASARAAWPGVTAPADEFAAYLRQRVAEGPPSDRRLCSADLYLAWACARGDKVAIETFQLQFLPQIDRALVRINAAPSEVVEVQAHVRQRLFYPHAEGRPVIERYTGRGPLGAWLRAVAVRAAMNLRRRDAKGVALDDFGELPGTAGDPELAYLKSRYATDFSLAVRDALESLATRDRNLLRQHHFDGLSIDALARMYGVHRATAARRLASVRASVLQKVRILIQDRLQLTESEFESALRLVASQLDASVERLLATSDEGR